MYNRYLRQDDAVFRPVPFFDKEEARMPHDPPLSPLQELLHPGSESSPIARLLSRFRPEETDTGDLMLLALLFFLMEEKADDELLIALGLLLIL